MKFSSVFALGAVLCAVPALSVRTLPTLEYQMLAKGKISEPLDLEFDTEGKLWVTCRRGEIWLIDTKTGEQSLVTKLDVDHSGERGLHGIEFHPEHAKNGLVYLYYATQTEDGHFNQLTQWKVTRGKKTTLSEEKVLFTAPSEETGFHEGGALRYNPKDGKLYLTLGDNLRSPETDKFFDNAKANPQNLEDLRGKVLRFNLDGTIPSDNPFVGKAGARPEIYTYGHRNAYSMSIDYSTGKVYVGEVGFDRPTNSEEFNLLKAGGNYGWPRCIGRNTGTFDGPCPIAGAIDPFLSYLRQSTASTTIGSFAHKGAAILAGHDYEKGFFYADMVRKWVRFAYFKPGTEEIAGTTLFAVGMKGGPLSMRLGPDGALYFVEYSGWFNGTPEDKVGRLVPVAHQTADAATGKEGHFKAAAWLEQGTAFKNSLACDLKVRFVAKGEWKFSPGAAGSTAAGLKLPAPAEFLVPGAPVSALVVRRTDGSHALQGEDKEIVIKAGETVRFLNNDAVAGVGGLTFDDNDGSLDLTWSHGGCK